MSSQDVVETTTATPTSDEVTEKETAASSSVPVDSDAINVERSDQEETTVGDLAAAPSAGASEQPTDTKEEDEGQKLADSVSGGDNQNENLESAEAAPDTPQLEPKSESEGGQSAEQQKEEESAEIPEDAESKPSSVPAAEYNKKVEEVGAADKEASKEE